MGRKSCNFQLEVEQTRREPLPNQLEAQVQLAATLEATVTGTGRHGTSDSPEIVIAVASPGIRLPKAAGRSD
jgi:hypothetical protein